MEYKFGSYGEIAHSDLDTAIIICTKGGPAKAVVFYAQQACEKIMKHYIQLKLKDSSELSSLLKSHKLKRLSTATGIEALRQYRADIFNLQDAYVEGMYPGDDHALPTMGIAIELLDAAKSIVGIVDNAISDIVNKQTEFFKFSE